MLPSIAYGRLMRQLRDLETGALASDEADVLREAADARLFGDADADERTGEARRVLMRLEDFDRLGPEVAAGLRRQLWQVVPVRIPAAPAVTAPSAHSHLAAAFRRR